MREEGILHELREHAMRVTRALYRVSARFPEHEPLRGHCREYADVILARISAWDGEKPADGIAGRIDALRNCLMVAEDMQWVPAINIEVLNREYTLLRDHVEQALLWEPKHQAGKSMLEDLDAPISSAPEVLRPRQERRTEPARTRPAPNVYHEPNPRQKKILQHIASSREAKISDLFPVLSGVSSKTIQRDLSELVNKNFLKKQGEKRWTMYSLV